MLTFFNFWNVSFLLVLYIFQYICLTVRRSSIQVTLGPGGLLCWVCLGPLWVLPKTCLCCRSSSKWTKTSTLCTDLWMPGGWDIYELVSHEHSGTDSWMWTPCKPHLNIEKRGACFDWNALTTRDLVGFALSHMLKLISQVTQWSKLLMWESNQHVPPALIR